MNVGVKEMMIFNKELVHYAKENTLANPETIIAD